MSQIKLGPRQGFKVNMLQRLITFSTKEYTKMTKKTKNIQLYFDFYKDYQLEMLKLLTEEAQTLGLYDIGPQRGPSSVAKINAEVKSVKKELKGV